MKGVREETEKIEKGEGENVCDRYSHCCPQRGKTRHTCGQFREFFDSLSVLCTYRSHSVKVCDPLRRPVWRVEPSCCRRGSLAVPEKGIIHGLEAGLVI